MSYQSVQAPSIAATCRAASLAALIAPPEPFMCLNRLSVSTSDTRLAILGRREPEPQDGRSPGAACEVLAYLS